MTMKTVELRQVFSISSGNKFDLNKMNVVKGAAQPSINFVSRTSKNLGISAKVARIKDAIPYPEGAITVALGGSILATNVQPREFYTGQNVCVLVPHDPNMSFEEKIYYCSCIELNKFRYSAFGREANRTLRLLQVPESVPAWIKANDEIESYSTRLRELIKAGALKKVVTGNSNHNNKAGTTYNSLELAPLNEIFDVFSGTTVDDSYLSDTRESMSFVPYVRPSKFHNGAYIKYANTNFVNKNNIFPKNTLYVSTNGQGSHSHAYVSNYSFVPNSDVAVLIPKQRMTLIEKIYYAEVITKNRWLHSYGRKPKGRRLERLKIPRVVPSEISSLLDQESLKKLNNMLFD